MNTLSIVAIILYLVGAIRLIMNIRNKSASDRNNTITSVICFIAVILHAVILIKSLDLLGQLNLGFYNAASLTGCLIALFVLLMSLKKPILNIAIIVLPMAALAILLAMMFPSDFHLVEQGDFGLDLHILLSLIAYSLLTIAALQACLLAFQDRQLRNKQATRIMDTLPPLQVMEELLIQVMALGFFVLSLSLATGLMFLHDMFAQDLAHKTILSLLAWLLFAILLLGRWIKGWRGQTLTYWTLGGFILLMLGYFGSKFIYEMLLDKF